jgi:hypothetical protein
MGEGAGREKGPRRQCDNEQTALILCDISPLPRRVGVHMQSAKDLREQAARLLAMAISAQGNNDHELAEMYTRRAGERIEQAVLLESGPIPSAPEQPVAQRQQHIQKNKR